MKYWSCFLSSDNGLYFSVPKLVHLWTVSIVYGIASKIGLEDLDFKLESRNASY